MTDRFDLLVKGGTLVNHDGRGEGDVAVKDGRIAAIGQIDAGTAETVIDASGLHVLPGVIDSQVHLREPGLEHKDDLEHGGRAAVLGGVTAVFEMPNTKPATTDVPALEDKISRAMDRMFCDFAFFGGATGRNGDDLRALESAPGCCGIKMFMGSSTGSLLVHTDDGVREVLRAVRRRLTVHSEDEDMLRDRRELAEFGKVETHPVWRSVDVAVSSTTRLLRLAREAGGRVHVLHVSTAEEVPLLAGAKDVATMELLPQHLTLAAPECYERLGTLAQMNPPIRDARHRDALWQALRDGVVDVIGSDHAPHTLEEKRQPYPKSPSGLPGVQTLVPIMLNHVNEGRLSLERFVDLTSHGVQRVFGLAGKGRMAVGYDGDLTLVDMGATRTITNDWIASKCGWTPFDGMQVKGWPMATIIRGRVVMRDDEIQGEAGGQACTFMEALPKRTAP